MATLLKIQQTNGQLLYFFAMLASICVYIIVSLLTAKEPFNLDKLLHRKQYKVEEDQVHQSAKPVRGLKALIGVSDEFSFIDKAVYIATLGWSLMWVFMFTGVGLAYLLYRNPDFWQPFWEKYWLVYLIVVGVLGFIFTCIFVLGGLADLRFMFKRLSEVERDALDDGMVFPEDKITKE
jgi:SSS family solute:Na+ symporter